jgi:hypothetical protein
MLWIMFGLFDGMRDAKWFGKNAGQKMQGEG